VRLDRRGAQDELGGDVGVGQPGGDECEHLELPRGELLEAAPDLGTGLVEHGEALEEPSRDGGRQQRVAGGDEADRVEQIRRLDALVVVPRG
jgi:hypothetical protein